MSSSSPNNSPSRGGIPPPTPSSPHSGKSTHGNDSLPQSYINSNDHSAHHNKNARRDNQQQQQQQHQDDLEYNGLIAATTTIDPRTKRKNCCTWKVATIFLLCVAISLVVAWQLLPAEDMVVKWIPQFPEPENPYLGPEAGGDDDNNASSGNSGGGGNGGGITIGNLPPSQTPSDGDDATTVGMEVPSFMKCPENGGGGGGDDELCCNGSPNNCNLRLSEMMFGLVHNAMSSEEGGFFIGYNQKYGLEKALVAGYRGLNLDVCNCNGVLQFCHNVCDLGERMPNEVFTNTLQFLNDYPSEVIVLVFQASKDAGGSIIWNDLYSEMTNVDGFADMIYVHTYGNEWPTMRELVTQNKRIVIFYFNGGSCTDGSTTSHTLCPGGFHYFYNYASETRYDSASVQELQNYEYSCEVTRGPKEGARPADFFVVNNFITPPDPEAAKTTNSKSFVSERLTQCANVIKMRPNFVYLDFWNQGVTAQLVQYANEQYAEELGR